MKKVGDIIYIKTPLSPGRIVEILPDNKCLVRWLTAETPITTESLWRTYDFEQYVLEIEKRFLKYKKKLDQTKNMA